LKSGKQGLELKHALGFQKVKFATLEKESGKEKRTGVGISKPQWGNELEKGTEPSKKHYVVGVFHRGTKPGRGHRQN